MFDANSPAFAVTLPFQRDHLVQIHYFYERVLRIASHPCWPTRTGYRASSLMKGWQRLDEAIRFENPGGWVNGSSESATVHLTPAWAWDQLMYIYWWPFSCTTWGIIVRYQTRVNLMQIQLHNFFPRIDGLTVTTKSNVYTPQNVIQFMSSWAPESTPFCKRLRSSSVRPPCYARWSGVNPFLFLGIDISTILEKHIS